MGRHSNGKNNYALSGGVVFALAAVLVLLGGVTWFLAARGGDASDEAEPRTCVSGELQLPIAAANESVARELIAAYQHSAPVVRDYCVNPQYTDSLADAAVYVAPNTAVSHQRLAQANRTAAVAEPAAAYADVVGLAGSSEPGADVRLSDVRFPTDTPESSAIAAAVLADTDDQAVAALTNQRLSTTADFDSTGDAYLATSELAAPEGLAFRPLAASVIYAAIPLNSGETVNENQSRAGQDFARFAAERFEREGSNAPEQPVVPEVVWAAALPAGGEQLTRSGASLPDAPDAAVAAAGQPQDTLFLLDTSDAMAPYIEQAKSAVAAAAGEVGAAGNQVALWNYSSPLTPGVTQGYRTNVAMTPDAAEVQAAVQCFLTGGEPRTREAVIAAAASMTGPGRIVVVTTGTADAGDDEAFTSAIQAAPAGASIAVVHVGPGQRDATLESVASSRQQADTGEELAAAVAAAAGVRG